MLPRREGPNLCHRWSPKIHPPDGRWANRRFLAQKPGLLAGYEICNGAKARSCCRLAKTPYSLRRQLKFGLGSGRNETPFNERYIMKTMLTRLAVLVSVVLLVLAGSHCVRADEPLVAAAEKGKVFKGHVVAVDGPEKTVSVKGVLFRKTFQTAEPCPVSLEDKPAATLDQLRPGHLVEVDYQDAHGVLVATRIAQHNLVLDGVVAAIDPDRRTLALKSPGRIRNLTIAEDCTVVLKDEKAGALDNLKVGHRVRVTYDPADTTLIAHKIAQSAEAFVGTIQAIDAGTRTVRARSFMTERKFNLADGCRIVVDTKPDADLRDLRIGDRVEFSYENAAGVLVANRIGRESNRPANEMLQAAKSGNP